MNNDREILDGMTLQQRESMSRVVDFAVWGIVESKVKPMEKKLNHLRDLLSKINEANTFSPEYENHSVTRLVKDAMILTIMDPNE